MAWVTAAIAGAAVLLIACGTADQGATGSPGSLPVVLALLGMMAWVSRRRRP
jgi:hypothetical protein